MESGTNGYAIHESANVATVEVDIDPALLESLEALPDRTAGVPKRKWTASEDAVLLRGWGKKRQVDIANLLGISTNTCRDRLRELTNGKD